MTIQFCDQCGDLLPETTNPTVDCECSKSLGTVTTTTYQSESQLRKSGLQQLTEKEKKPAQNSIKQDCPNCNAQTLYYSVVQLRSADEGSTVFYDCHKCHHKFKEDN
ncbi:transcription factor S-II [Colletotrichum abscissum]|uniref:DNA-directed RNA polymerase subunit n=1 Tax=Colletotrichum abscissum TaxID=1671311 RepID=A0A9Q0AUP6_9PEZI|nr:transcription factor S-II [Colletotrichum abscissum]